MAATVKPMRKPWRVVAYPSASRNIAIASTDATRRAADHVGRNHHVGRHQRHHVVEDDADRIDGHDVAGAVQRHCP